MALRDVARNAMEAVIPPSRPVAEERAKAVRAETVEAGQALEAARAALSVADESGDAGQIQKAEAAIVAAERAADRATRGLDAAERRLRQATEAEAANALEAGRRKLAELKVDREQQGRQITAALDALEAGVKAFSTNEAALLALPVAVRGSDATPGHLLGVGPLQAHLSMELRERGITGMAGSSGAVNLTDWIAVGNRTLAS